jgi:outer membrane murein-binding lipoprotein Lpp
MKRFLMLMSVAVVAAAMYVAAGSASQQSTGPTAKQFKALKAQVAALSKRVKKDETSLDTLAFAYVHCSLPSMITVDQRSGYQNGAGTTTALDIGNINPAYFLTTFNNSDQGCQNLVGAAPLQHHAARTVAQQFAQKH